MSPKGLHIEGVFTAGGTLGRELSRGWVSFEKVDHQGCGLKDVFCSWSLSVSSLSSSFLAPMSLAVVFTMCSLLWWFCLHTSPETVEASGRGLALKLQPLKLSQSKSAPFEVVFLRYFVKIIERWLTVMWLRRCQGQMQYNYGRNSKQFEANNQKLQKGVCLRPGRHTPPELDTSISIFCRTSREWFRWAIWSRTKYHKLTHLLPIRISVWSPTEIAGCDKRMGLLIVVRKPLFSPDGIDSWW